ncbi:PQQ-binding-like beta-propeller repeat protein [Candidatus Woesearchaeota archaeon]|nr:PQQ-binding-like beta-propeller repeat protein [Candidatus Woesearchaeota archaeon]
METIILPKSDNKAEQEEYKRELKSLILNSGVVWGNGLDENNLPYKWVIDTKSFLLNPRGLYLTTELFMEKIRKYNPDAVGGLTLASHLIASALVYSSYGSDSGFDGFLVRRERKQYSMMKLVEGVCKEKSRVVIVDDGLNSAGYSAKAIKAVEDRGCKVLAVIVLTNFEKEEYFNLKERGYNVEGIFTLKELGLDSRHTELNPGMFELKWRYGAVNGTHFDIPKSSPVIDSDKIYIGSDLGKMLCLDLSGRLLWEFKTDYDPEGVHATPLVAGNKVICAGYDGALYALDKDAGSLIWKNNVCNWIGATPSYDEETNCFYAGLENSTLKGTLAAINADDGNLEWEFTTENHVPCKAVVADNLVIFGSNDCHIYALNKKNGELEWSFRTYSDVKGRITIDDGLCYVSGYDGCIYCLKTATGSLIWKKKLGKSLYNQPLIHNGKVMVGSFSGQLTALDKKSGKVLWYFMTDGTILSHPVCYNGSVFFGSRDGCIYAVNAEDGSLLWRFITGGAVTSSPALYKNMLFINSNDGYLYCFGKKQL